MLAVVGVLRLFGSVVAVEVVVVVVAWPFFSLSSFFRAFCSLTGDDVDDRDCDCCCCCCCEETTHDFLRSFVRDRAGELPGDSACFTASVRPRSALRSGVGSADGSLLLLEKGRKREDRRVLGAGLSCGICTPASSGASSDDGLDPPEQLSDVRSPLLPMSASSSPAGDSWSNSLTRGK
jgi:hypothetical protein